METYHLVIRGQQAGPFTLEQIRQMLARGEIQPEQPGWRPGMTAWQPLSSFLPSVRHSSGSGSPPPLPGMAVTMPPKPVVVKRSRVWLWVLLGVAGVLAFLAAVVFFIVQEVRRDGTDDVSWLPLMEDRAGHEPKWRKSSFKAAGPADEPDGKTFDLIRYRSPAGELAAYLTPDPKDGKKHPAMVWAHGGFGGIGSYFWDPASKRNDQSARAFREKGIVMMMPSWRGENDNPGRFELFYGEVEDFLAAIEHVKKLPYVDPRRVYIGGHSTGGTMTLLAAAATDQFKAAFSFGGLLDGVGTLGDGEGYGNTPYNLNSKRDHRLRSPLRYAAFFQRPVFYFEGGEYFDSEAARKMQLRAKTQFQAFHLPGDHFDILYPVTRLIAEKISADQAITFTDAELQQSYAAAFANSLAAQLARWNLSDGDLAALLKAGDPDDSIPHTKADAEAVADSMKRVIAQGIVAPLATANVATLAGLRDEIEDDDVLEAFDKRVPALLTRWARNRLAAPVKMAEQEVKDYFEVLLVLARSHDKEAADFIVEAARHAALADLDEWEPVLDAFDVDHPRTEHLMQAFAAAPPAGQVAVLLLDAANELCLDGWQGRHAFDSPKGAAVLRGWLKGDAGDESSHAHGAALGCAFIHTKDRGELIALALSHEDKEVRLEGAWADVHTGGTKGLEFLKKACMQIHDSRRARDYLKELDHEADIPKQALEPAFVAQADLSRWLQHPNELGSAPLSMEVFDHRKLHWPPTEDERELWLIRFTYPFKDDAAPKTGYGFVGSMTWCSFEDYPTPPTPEELYLHHCTLELERDEKRSENAAKEGEARTRALEALRKANPGVFDAVEPGK